MNKHFLIILFIFHLVSTFGQKENPFKSVKLKLKWDEPSKVESNKNTVTLPYKSVFDKEDNYLKRYSILNQKKGEESVMVQKNEFKNPGEEIKKKLNKSQSDEFTLFILWFLPIIPSAAIAIFCGIVRYSLFKYILLGISGLFFRAIIIGLIGWQAGELYYVAAEQISLIENYILIGLGLLILVGIIFLFYKNKKRNYV